MAKRNTEVDELREMITAVCGDSIAAEPAKFLASLMAGKDPRGKSSKLYKLIKSISDEDREPEEDEWIKIKRMVLGTDLYRPVPVSLDESSKAARELMNYLHAKLKNVSVRGKVAHKHVILTELTADEVETFEDWFTSNF